MIQLIIFDWDDVFTLGSREGYYACYRAAVDFVGSTASPGEVKEIVQKLWGRPSKDVIAEILRDDRLLDNACGVYEKCLFTDLFLNNLSLVPGSLELLQELRGRYKLAIATGGRPKLLNDVIMPKFGVPFVFNQILSMYDLTDPSRGKPYPDMILEILKREDVTSDHAIMVGDAKSDVLMAQAAEIIPVVVLTGHLNKEEAEALGVRFIIDDVTCLIKGVLEKL